MDVVAVAVAVAAVGVVREEMELLFVTALSWITA